MKKILTLCLVFCVALVSYGQKTYQLASPNGEIRMNVKVSDKIQYDIFYGEESLLEKGTMRMQVGGQVLGMNPKVVKSIQLCSTNIFIAPNVISVLDLSKKY